MKPFHLKNFAAAFGFFLFVILCSLGVSCHNKKSPVSLQVYQDTLSDILDSSEAKIFEANYYDAKNNQLDRDFYFDPGGSKQQKVIAFYLNPAQQQAFFQELVDFKNAQQDTTYKDSVSLRIHLASITKKGFKKHKHSNIAPLLQIVNTKTYINSEYYYSLRAFYNPDTSTLTNASMERFNPLSAIKKRQVHQFVDSWLKVPFDSISDQVCIRDPQKTNCERVNYYTVDASDTQDIYRFLLKHKKSNKFNSYFNVYFGVEKGNGKVNLRTITHISTKQVREKGKAPLNIGEEDGEEDFEFPAPCPPVCQ